MWLVLGGFALRACLPIVLEWAERHAGSSHQGVAVAFLIMAGNVGSLVAILALGGVIASGVTAPLLILAVLGAAGRQDESCPDASKDADAASGVPRGQS